MIPVIPTINPDENRLFQMLVASKRIGLYAENLRTGEKLLDVHARVVFPTASVIKIAIIVTLYHLSDKGELALDEVITVDSNARVGGSGILNSLSNNVSMTLRDFAVLMMHISDNTATNMLLKRIGASQVNTLLLACGLNQTHLNVSQINVESIAHNPLAFGVATPYDLAMLLKQLTQGAILTPASCHEVLSIMKRDVVNRRLGGRLPMRSNITVCHKSGTATGVYNDVGIVHFTDGDYVFCALTNDAPTTDDPRSPAITEELIAGLSRSVYDYIVPS